MSKDDSVTMVWVWKRTRELFWSLRLKGHSLMATIHEAAELLAAKRKRDRKKGR